MKENAFLTNSREVSTMFLVNFLNFEEKGRFLESREKSKLFILDLFLAFSRKGLKKTKRTAQMGYQPKR